MFLFFIAILNCILVICSLIIVLISSLKNSYNRSIIKKERCKLLAVRGVHPFSAERALPKVSLYKVQAFTAYRDLANSPGKHFIEIERTKYFHLRKALWSVWHITGTIFFKWKYVSWFNWSAKRTVNHFWWIRNWETSDAGFVYEVPM